MKHYTLMSMDCFDGELVSKCGSLFPFITSLSKAKAYARKVKKQFPNATLQLFEGETWGELELIETF